MLYCNGPYHLLPACNFKAPTDSKYKKTKSLGDTLGMCLKVSFAAIAVI